MTIAYFDCFSGASGDMLLACLLDAGLVLEDLLQDLDSLAMGPYRLIEKKVTRHGLSGTHLQVVEGDGVGRSSGPGPARNLPAVEAIIGHSELPDPIKARSLEVFRRIARAEAKIHGSTIDEVHFHEISAVDSLVDIVGFVCALDRLGVEAVYSSPLTLGSGTVQTMHGRLPAPAPATLALLAEAGVPAVEGPARTELVTPTGAALLSEFATFERPDMTIRGVGYGFGSKEFDWPNALRVWLGDAWTPAARPDRDEVVELACNLDDASGELLGYVMSLLFEAGALDVWFTPIQMKKNRPATQVSVLARPENADDLANILLRETPTLGVRHKTMERRKAGREAQLVQTPWGPVRVKVKVMGGRAVSVSPEYDDCARLAAEHEVPLVDVLETARQRAGIGKPSSDRNTKGKH